MEEQMKEQAVEAVKTVSVPKESKGKKIAVAILISVLLLGLFYIIQFAVAIAMMVVSIVGKIVSGGSAVQQEIASLSQDEDFLTLVTGISTFATAVVFAIWYKLQYAKKFGMAGWAQMGRRMLHVRTILLMVFSAVAVNMLSHMIIAVMDQVAHETVTSYTEMMGLALGGNPVIVFLTLVVLAPIGEECLFRGLIFGRLQKSMPVLAALIIESVMFGIFHANPVQGIYVIALGLVTGYAVYKTHSIMAGIVIHAINNGMGYIISLLPEAIFESIFGLLAIFAAAVLGIFLVWKFMEDQSYGVSE